MTEQIVKRWKESQCANALEFGAIDMTELERENLRRRPLDAKDEVYYLARQRRLSRNRRQLELDLRERDDG